MIYSVKNHFVISSRGTWLPGAYSTRAAARFAFQFDADDLRRLQESKNPGGVISTEDLRKLRAEKPL